MADGDVCCVLQCPLSEPSRSMRSVCFFAFPHPSDPRYPVWIERTLRPKGWTPSAASTICSRHFCSADILTVPSAEDCEKTERRLKHDALPSLFEGIPRSLQPPVGSVPRPDSPEIGASSVLKMHRPVESVPRPDSPEIAVASSKKRSADSCLSTLELPPTKAARVDKETIERCTASPKATPSMAEACVAPLASPAPMLYFPSPDILFRPQSSDQAVAAKPLPLPPQSAAVAPSSNSANELERGVKVALVSPCSSAKPASAVVDADTVQICCVPGCLITSRNASGTVLFPFLLPDHELYDTWVKQIRCTAFWQPQPPSYICSQHFHRSDWEVCRISGNIRKAPLTTLRDGVVPFRSACIAAFHFSGVRDGEAAKAQTKVCDVRTCLACGAKRNGWTKPSEILMFYPFPKDIHLRSKWINCLPDLTRHQMDTEQSLVCQNHFDAEDFELGSGCGILKASAVPKRRPRFGTRSRRKKGEGKVGKKSEVCCVPGCRIPPEELGSGRITYTRFPVDEARRDKWISCMQCAVSWAPCRGDDMVCSRHFTTRDFPQSVAKIRRLASSGLKQSAVPSQLECVEKFRTPINPKIPLDEIQCCCICGWWRSTELCKRSERLTFFPFPKLTVQWKLWIAACRELNPEFVFSFGLLVCENHFKPEDWRWQTWNTSKLILKPTAVPSIKTPSFFSSPTPEISEEQRACKEGDVAAPDAGLPLDANDTPNATEMDDLRWHLHVSDNVPLDTNAPSGSTDANASYLPSLPIASCNGLPGEENEENSFDPPLVTPSLPTVTFPAASSRDVIQTPTVSTASAPPCDTFIYCEPCCKLMQTPCWIHSDSIPDEPVIPMATSSLPKVLYMDVCDESPTGKTVYVREAVMRHTVFGPLIAPTVFSDDEKARYVDVSDLGEEAKRKQYQLDSDYLCNWMKHVRLADSVEASNLLVFARGCEIVFVTSRTISPHEELRVWYSRQYLDLLNPVTPQDVDSDGEMSGVEAERRMPDSVIKEESFADHCGEKMLDPLSFQRDVVTSATSPDPDNNTEIHGASGENSTDGDINDDGCRKHSGGEIINNTPIPNGICSPQLAPTVKPHTHFYTCKECGMRFTNISVLNLHKLGYQPAAAADSQSHVRKCPECGVTFEYLGDLIQHVDLHGDLTCCCPVCDLRCSDLKHHIRQCHPEFYAAEKKRVAVVEAARSMRQAFRNSVTCSECGLQFISALLCSVHKMKHNSVDSGEEGDLCDLRICPPCGQMFAEFQQLVDHVEEHGQVTEKCPVCQQRFVSLEEHFKHNHPDLSLLDCDEQARKEDSVESNAQLQCRQCEKRFRTPDHLKIHKAKMHNQKALTCDRCGQRFRLDALSRLHKMQHGDSYSARWVQNFRTCLQCGEQFAKLEKLLMHIEVHGVAARKCPLCGQRFAALKAHLRQDHQQDGFPLCDNSFPLQSALRAQEKLHQPATPVSDNLTCGKCGLRFRSHMLSQLHRLKHKGNPSGNNVEKELTCPKCGDIFDEWQELMDHVEEHGLPTEKCRCCDEWFDNLDAHLRLGNCRSSSQLECSSDPDTTDAGLLRSSSIYNKSSSEHYPCQDCGKEFEHKSDLSEHQKKHLNLTFIKSFTCHQCGIRFTTDALHQLHVLQHGSIVDVGMRHPRERRCPHCNKSCQTLTELVEHVDQHGRTTDKCSQCNRWFGHLPGHMRRNHPRSTMEDNVVLYRESSPEILEAPSIVIAQENNRGLDDAKDVSESGHDSSSDESLYTPDSDASRESSTSS